MRALADRIARTLGAGVIGALQAFSYISIGLVVAILVVQIAQAGFRWYESGTFAPFPATAASSTGAASIDVATATPAQAAAIRMAVNSLSYQLPPHAVLFAVTSEPCPQCGGEYDPGLNLIQIQQGSAVEGPALRHAVAHEIGHYVDLHYLNNSQRDEFMRLRHIPANQSWFFDTGQPWANRPVEDFAEVFAVVALWPNDELPGTSYGPVRDPAPFEQLLGSAGVRFDRTPARSSRLSEIKAEVLLVRDMLVSSSLWFALQMLVVVYVAIGAGSAIRGAWRRNP